MMIKNIVLTYFEPFGVRSFNASKAVVDELSTTSNKIGLPVNWDEISNKLDEVFLLEPDYLFLFGEAGSISSPRLELEAHNISRGKDNIGNNKEDEKIITEGKDTLYTSFITDDNFPLSTDAGTYLCNCSYYLSLNKNKNTKVIFIHVPAFNEEDIEKKKASTEVADAMIRHLLELNP